MTRSPVQPPRRGFTLVELLVVVMIISLLAAILLPALNYARQTATTTAKQAQLSGIANAAEAYHQTYSAYPGYFDDEQLYWGGDRGPRVELTANQNLVLSLMGRVVPAGDASGPTEPLVDGMVAELDSIGLGPRSRNGRVQDAFYSPSSGELLYGDELVQEGYPVLAIDVPMIVDPVSGKPIFYSRVSSDRGIEPVHALRDRSGGNVRGGRIIYGNYLEWDGGYFGTGSLLNDDPDGNLAMAFVDDRLSPVPPGDTLSFEAGGGQWPANDVANVISGGFVLMAPDNDGVFFPRRNVNDPGIENKGQLQRYRTPVHVGGSR